MRTKVYINGLGHMTLMDGCQAYIWMKPLIKQKSAVLQTWHVASGIQALQS